MSKGESIKLFLNLRDAFSSGNFTSLEIQIKGKDKDPFIGMLQGAISVERDGKTAVCRLSLQDVTGLREAKALQQQHEDLQRETEKIQQYLDLAPVVFLLIDTEHKVQMINQKGCSLLGYDRLEIVGNNWFENFTIEANGNGIDKSNQKFNRKKLLLSPYFEGNLRFRNGESRLMAWTNTSLLGKNGDLIGTLCAGEDITERKRIESDKQRYTHGLEEIVVERTKELSDALESEKLINEMKSAFISIASHELRTPITIVMSSISLIEKYNELGNYQKQQKHIDRIKSSVGHFKNILDDFLSLEQLQKGNIRVDQVTFNLRDFVRNVLEEMDGILKEDQQINYTHQGNTEVFLDRKIFRNILLNLLSNAIKYSNTAIDLNTVVGNDKLILSIKDRGIGIPEEEQHNLFERFFRAKNAENIQGTGLGLSIVIRYLELLGGTIEFTSKLNQGSTFIIKLPQND